jgi:hypothetical protein
MRFVSAFLDLNEERVKEKSVEKYLELLNQLIATGISLHLFISPKFADKIPLANDSLFVEFIDLEDLDIYKMVSKEISLPPQRNPTKDTLNYMILMNAKMEFVKRAMNRFHEETTFAWIDSGIFHVFKRPEETTKYLQELSQKRFSNSYLFFPGAWKKGYAEDRLFTQINWRFLGGFFSGHRESLACLWNVYLKYFQQIIETNCLTWEVNLWAYLESYLNFPFTWVLADHDDSIVKVPEGIFN